MTDKTEIISIAITVYNESNSINVLLDSLVAQTVQPDEILFVDGGSTDGTVDRINAFSNHLPVRVLVIPQANISTGRNAAINATKGQIIAVTDAGVRLEPDWLEQITKPLRGREEKIEAVAGFFQADPANVFELALGATTLPLKEEINPATFLPSSRSVAFTRRAWKASGGYPTWLDYCEDLLFDFQLRARCDKIHWAPNAVVHFRPRKNLRQFAQQYYRYARGDGKADLWRTRHGLRYLTYLIVLPALTLVASRTKFTVLLLLLSGLLYLRRPWLRLQRLWQAYSQTQRMIAACWVPAIRLSGDIAKMIGYPVGCYWRWRNRRRQAVHWRQALPHPARGNSGGKVI